MRIAIIKSQPIRTYTGTSVHASFDFLCWEDDAFVGEKMEKAIDEGYDIFKVAIPVVKP